MPPTKVKSGEARAKWRDILDQVFAGKGDVIIERNGKDIAVLIPADDYEQVREILQKIRAVREATVAYETLEARPATVDTKKGTATIPLEAYEKLIAERDARFEVIKRIQSLQPDYPPEEVEREVAEAITRVRGQDAESSH
jgi:prevent-host-death family protein